MNGKKRRARALRRAAERHARRRTGTLAMLTTSAMALLPDLAAAQAKEGWSAEYGYSMYSEGNLRSGKLSYGSRNRYDIDTHQVRLAGPLASRLSFGLDVAYEKMSGASPWFTEPDFAGDTRVVMTGASIRDARTDALASLTYEGASSRTTGSLGASLEDDYTSYNVGISRERDYNEKATTLSLGAAVSIDESDPTPTSFTPDPTKHHKRSGTASIGIAQILDHASVLQSALTFQYASGFLSDPYKLVSSGGLLYPDHRPDARVQLSWLTRYRRHFEKLYGSLHGDYQLYWDDWSVLAHTLELGWYQDITDYVTIAPSVRYYTQRAASFYAPYYAAGLPAGQHASSDYRLSEYGALAYKLRAELRLAQLLHTDGVRLGLQWEHYESGGKFALGGGPENPGLVDFDLMTVTLRTEF